MTGLPAAVPVVGHATPAVTTGVGRTSLVLVVDDEEGIRSGVAKALKREGLDVAMEATGEAALETVRLLKPDLVLLDVGLPGMNGYAVCRGIKGDIETRLTPVVLLTGRGSLEDRVCGLEAGADDFLTKPYDRSELLARVRSSLKTKLFTDELECAESVLFTLARSIEGRDASTEGHCERLSAYATALGRHMGLSADEITALDRAGAVHDIGKVAVPDAILLKSEPLSPDEWAVMRKHPLIGDYICSPLRSFRLVLPIIRHHHEKLDGSGYPDGLAGAEIPLTARVLQVVDVYDALTTARPYKPALAVADAWRTLDAEVAKGWWDPDVVAAFRTLRGPPADEQRGQA
jgi:putative two-component system response regulator